MGLLTLLLCLGVISTSLVLSFRRLSGIWSLLLGLLLPILILGFWPYDLAPRDIYPYKAHVILKDASGSDFRTTIYFKTFAQDGNYITIPKYARLSTHFLDFKRYDAFNGSMTIQLSDNKGQFYYIDRNTEEVINRVVDATQ